jgi:hypothetical protein
LYDKSIHTNLVACRAWIAFFKKLDLKHMFARMKIFGMKEHLLTLFTLGIGVHRGRLLTV